MLISQSISNLINGVSQQDAKLRLSTQCEAQVNCQNSVITGMGKRPNTVKLAKCPEFPRDKAFFVSDIDRDQREQYKLVITDGKIQVFDKVTGFSYPVKQPANSTYLKFYSQRNPQAQFQTLTTADTTFILNKEVSVTAKH